MKEQDIRDIEDVIYEVTRKKNRFWLQLGLIFVFSVLVGAGISLYVSR